MLKKLLKLFFPEICIGCEAILLTQEDIICTICRHNIAFTNYTYVKENQGFRRFYGRLNVEFVSSIMYYKKNSIVQKIIHQLKYKNCQEIGTLLGNWHIDDLKKNSIISTVDYIIPVPLHAKRMKERGYNQVATFCESISVGLNKKVLYDLLFRDNYTTSQSKKDLTNRNKMLHNTFSVKYSDVHHNKHFLLIDDVLTTGATLEMCGKEILKIPNTKLSILTMAISQS